MKKLFLLLAAVIISLPCAMAQDVDVFVKGGIGMSNYIGKDVEGADVKFSYRLGVGLDVPLENVWGFQTGLYLTGLGAKNKESISGIEAETKLKPIYLELPVMATVNVPLNNDFKMQIGVGPYLALGVGGKAKGSVEYQGQTIEEDIDLFGSVEDGNAGMKRFDCGLGVNINFEVKRIIFGLDTRFGLTNVIEDSKSHNLSAQFVVGYRF